MGYRRSAEACEKSIQHHLDMANALINDAIARGYELKLAVYPKPVALSLTIPQLRVCVMGEECTESGWWRKHGAEGFCIPAAGAEVAAQKRVG
jgi:hypothetical protein